MGVDLLNRVSLKKGKKITMSIASSNVTPKKYYNYSKNYNEKNIGNFIGDLLFRNKGTRWSIFKNRNRI